MSELNYSPVVPQAGWHVLHLFYRIEHGQWALLSPEERIAAKTNLTEVVQDIRALPETQLLIFSMVTPKADLGMMLVTPDLQVANACEKRLTLSLGPDVLTPAYSFLSLTEASEYFQTEEEYGRGLQEQENLLPDSPDYAARLTEWTGRMQKYKQARLYPVLPDWEVFCFYPMSKRRAPGQNWYATPYADRKKLMEAHGRIGRTYHGKVSQLITGCTGLDDAEWGVTLFAHDTFQIKDIVYTMRFDTVSAEYADFGEFFIGLSLPLDELFRRLLL